jgi:hypothetical protein
MDDDYYLKERNLIRINTNYYIENGVILLFNIIKENLSISSRVIHGRNNQYIIVIEKGNVYLTQNITLPYMYPSMLYKLGIQIYLISKFDYFNIINKV